jgi:endonuclease/exonuclease/phosphatase family metal-dependent hydrolase
MSLNFCTYETAPAKSAPAKSAPSLDASSIKSSQSTDISIMSWNINPKVIEPKNKFKETNLLKIKKYIKDTNSDIIFTQEALIEDIDTSKYTTIQTHYKKKSGKAHSNALTIHILKSKFEIDDKLIRRGGYNMTQKKYENIITSLTPSTYDYGNSDYIRPILACRIKNNSTKKNYILVNVWAPHDHDINKNYDEYINHITDIIKKLYRDDDRIIIAGDFNEFYVNNTQKNKSIELMLNFRKITLYLMQKENTLANKVLDLLFDSEKNTKVVVDTNQKLSDHYPIIGTIHSETQLKLKKGGNRNLRSIVRSKIRSKSKSKSKLKNKLRNKTNKK